MSQVWWQILANEDTCQSEAQSLATDVWLNQRRDGTIPLNGNGTPQGVPFRDVAKVLNRFGFRTETGRAWKETRTQQVIAEGLARKAVASQLDRLELVGISYEEAYEATLPVMKEVLRRRRKSERSREKKTEYHQTVSIDGEVVMLREKPKCSKYWAKKKDAARMNGWKPPEQWFTPPADEVYTSPRRDGE